MSGHGSMNAEQFKGLLDAHLGPEHDEYHEAHEESYGLGTLPTHAYRVMSDEHYQHTLRTGFHQSDERNNYIGQAKADPETWAGQEVKPEGTVAGRWAELGYSRPNVPTRVARIRVDPKVGWKVHEDADDFVHTHQPIPAEHIEAVTPAFVRQDHSFDRWKLHAPRGLN